MFQSIYIYIEIYICVCIWHSLCTGQKGSRVFGAAAAVAALRGLVAFPFLLLGVGLSHFSGVATTTHVHTHRGLSKITVSAARKILLGKVRQRTHGVYLIWPQKAIATFSTFGQALASLWI